MRRIVVWLASTVTVVVLLFGYHTSTNKTSGSTASSVGGTSGATDRPTSGSASKSYAGAVAQTRWGPVQVQITVSDDTITKVTVLQQPDGNPRDTEINDYALPILTKATVSAQSAKIDMVSGATVTSEGYLQSLQSALDAAGR